MHDQHRKGDGKMGSMTEMVKTSGGSAAVKCQAVDQAADHAVNKAADYARIPKIAVKPCWSEAAAVPVISLDGAWEVKHTDSLERELAMCSVTEVRDATEVRNKADIGEGWRQVEIPSDMNAHRDAAFTGKYIYRRMIEVPRTGRGGHIVLKFEGVNGFAQVFIDGRAAASHKNGFVSWCADITDMVKDKEEALLLVTVDETADRLCSFNHGGILHSVYMYCLPEAWLDGIYLTTSFEDGYEDAVLRADVAISSRQAEDELLFQVYPPGGPGAQEVPEYELRVRAQSGETGCSTAFILMKKPYKWDAEHPWLYRLETSLIRDGRVLEKAERFFGVRQIERKENRLYVNGQEVKLRGVCRHEITPKNGRAVTKEIIDKDISLFKEANCNYIRTSHYPPSEYFLEQCDRHGIYVEDELDLAFIAKNLDYTQRDPAYTERYLSVFAEVLARDYSHPSVLIWSLANEAFGGYNYDLLNRFAHRMDPTRPTKFSYPMTMQAEHEGIDIWSIHYANVEGEPDKKCDNVSVGYTDGHDVPVLNDEYVHIPCYNRAEHRRDPNVRHFWGESLRLFWERIWETKGALGGAIWAGIDETDMFTDTREHVPMTKRNGDTCLEWGIIDVWRRRKPEHYMTRKAYTPALIREKTFKWAGGCALIQIENRFCHTDLSEVRIDWKAVPEQAVCAADNEAERKAENISGNAGSITGPPAAPGETALISIPAGNTAGNASENAVASTPYAGAGQNGNAAPILLELKIFDAFGNQVDEYCLRQEGWQEKMDVIDKEADYQEISIVEAAESIEVGNDDFKFCFSKNTGLLTRAERGGELLLTGGPILHVPYLTLGEWRLFSISAERDEGRAEAAVRIRGGYTDTADVTFTVRIRKDASFVTEYRIDRLYAAMPKEMKLRVGVDAGGLDELGVAYIAAPGMDSLSWKREGRYTVYPGDHIARLSGTAKRFSKGSAFAEAPVIPWSQEMKNYILNGVYDVDYRGTADFRSLKENIYAASLCRENGSSAVTAVSDGSCHVRAEVTEPEEYLVSDRDERIKYHGTWYPVEDFHGCRGNTEMVSCEKGAYAEFTFSGTGIVWFGSVDTINGIAKVWLDGKIADECINQKVAGVDFPGSAAGYDKKYGYPLYYVSGLPAGEHTVRIEVTGEKTADSGGCYIGIDYFRVLAEGRPEPVRFAVLNDFNYPQISWGNYKKPAIRIGSGYHNQIEMALTARR